MAVVAGWGLVIAFVAQPFVVPSSSMSPTLEPGDRILVSKLSDGYVVDRGDVVVFRDPGGWLPSSPRPSRALSVLRQAAGAAGFVSPDEAVLVKRVIAVGGDRVRCCDAKGRVLVNDRPVDESAYLHPADAPSLTEFQTVVPFGSLWLMGDHRSVSSDSRAHVRDRTGGMVSRHLVIGRAVAVLWPPRHAGAVRVPQTGQP